MSTTTVTYTMTLTPTNDALTINESGSVTPEDVALYFGTLIKGEKGDAGTGSADLVDVDEAGFYVTDSSYNVGFAVKADGIHAKNMLNFTEDE